MIVVDSLKKFKKVLEKNNFVLVDFFAKWCGPCKKILPTVRELSKKYNHIKFVKQSGVTNSIIFISSQSVSIIVSIVVSVIFIIIIQIFVFIQDVKVHIIIIVISDIVL